MFKKLSITHAKLDTRKMFQLSNITASANIVIDLLTHVFSQFLFATFSSEKWVITIYFANSHSKKFGVSFFNPIPLKFKSRPNFLKVTVTILYIIFQKAQIVHLNHTFPFINIRTTYHCPIR